MTGGQSAENNAVEHNEHCCMIGVPATAGPHPDCPGVRAVQTYVFPPGEGDQR